MRSLNERLVPWHTALIIGIAAIAIPAAAGVNSTGISVVSERQNYPNSQIAADSKGADAKHSGSGAALGRSVARLQDDYYDRRRQYWEKRVDSRLEYRDEYLDDQTGDNDDADADASDSKAGKDDEEDTIDHEEELIERRREYWRQRLDKEW